MIHLRRAALLLAVTWVAVLVVGCPSPEPGELVEQAQAQLNSRKFDQAIALLTRAVRMDSSMVEAWFLRGKAYGDRGCDREDGKDFGRAVGDFTRALVLRPDMADAFYFRGSALNALGKSENAFLDLGRATELKPDFPEAFLLRGTIQASLGNYDSALVDLDHALELSPGDPTVHMVKGLVYEEMGRKDDAIAAYESYISLVGTDPTMAVEVEAMEERIHEIKSGLRVRVLVDPHKGPGSGEDIPQRN
jgi:Flp pilus assembly protein TadD